MNLAALVILSALIAIGAASPVLVVDHEHHHDGEEYYPASSSSSTTEAAGPPNPYLFSYTAGRYPGHADRTHSEVSDGLGNVRGTYSYVDPAQEVRTVDYTADRNGFHPVLSHKQRPQKQSAAVRLATQKHLALYNQIAESHAHPEQGVQADVGPRDSPSVAYAKQRHQELFEKIARDHERIGAEQYQLRLAFEATSEIPIHI